jgi:hypothetical protein
LIEVKDFSADYLHATVESLDNKSHKKNHSMGQDSEEAAGVRATVRTDM